MDDISNKVLCVNLAINAENVIDSVKKIAKINFLGCYGYVKPHKTQYITFKLYFFYCLAELNSIVWATCAIFGNNKETWP